MLAIARHARGSVRQNLAADFLSRLFSIYLGFSLRIQIFHSGVGVCLVAGFTVSRAISDSAFPP